MPRKRRTASGHDAQVIKSTTGQRYGEAQSQQQMQRAMPAPQIVGGTPRTPAVSPETQPVSGAPMSDADLMAVAASMKGQAGLLTAPTNRPNEPVTAGLPVGPGPGPEAMGLRRGNPVGETMRELSRMTGDPLLAELAARSGL